MDATRKLSHVSGLWQAAALGLVDRVQAKLDRTPPAAQPDLDNALWCAAHGGQRDTVEPLLDRGADPTQVGHDQLDAAAAAERSGARELAAWLRAQSRSGPSLLLPPWRPIAPKLVARVGPRE